MADMEVIVGKKSTLVDVDLVQLSMAQTLTTGKRLVVVVDPTTLEGGTVLYDANVPAAKTFVGNIAINGELQ